jgi:hypothetical protein
MLAASRATLLPALTSPSHPPRGTALPIALDTRDVHPPPPPPAGAYYYYTTGNYSNYLDALLAVYADANAKGIPYRGWLADSWWYFKGIGDGVKNWTAMPNM